MKRIIVLMISVFCVFPMLYSNKPTANDYAHQGIEFQNMKDYRNAALQFLNCLESLAVYSYNKDDWNEVVACMDLNLAKYYEANIQANPSDAKRLMIDVCTRFSKIGGSIHEMLCSLYAIADALDYETYLYIGNLLLTNEKELSSVVNYYTIMAEWAQHKEEYAEAIWFHLQAIEAAETGGNRMLAYNKYTGEDKSIYGLNFNRWLSVSQCFFMIREIDQAIDAALTAKKEIEEDLGKKTKEYLNCISHIDFLLEIKQENERNN